MFHLTHFIAWRLRLAAATTQTTRAERDAIAGHCRGRERVVEIGVWHGVTTKRLKAAMAPTAELWAVDPYPVGRLGVSFPRLIAQKEVDTIENGRLRWVETSGAAAAAIWRREGRIGPDFIFIDGDHTWEGISGDWQAWSELVVPRGLIALHDSRSTPARRIDDAGSVRFTRDVIAKDPRFRIYDEVDSLTVVERLS